MACRVPIFDSVTFHVPFRAVKGGGRKKIQMSEGVRPVSRADNTLINVLARAFRWKRMLESGESIAELLEREGIAHSNMTYVLRLTLLALDIVKSIGRAAGAGVTLTCVLEPVPLQREAQQWLLADFKRPLCYEPRLGETASRVIWDA